MAVSDVISIGDIDQLASELAQWPIGRDPVRQEDEEAIETADALPPVAFMSITGSKGLSAHHVMMLGCDQVTMGYTTPLAFFVGLTRARGTLHLVVSARAGGVGAHPFVYDLPEHACEYVVHKKTSHSEEALIDRDAFVARLATWAKFRKG